jgi:DNA transposition AAA+ family ATPase
MKAMSEMVQTRESVRQQLRVYMSRTGWTAADIADRSGYSKQTIKQFISSARYGDASAQSAAINLTKFMAENPAYLPDLPGTLYETDATREMDRLIEHARCGGWGTIYGPAGAQKTFLLEYRWAQEIREAEPGLVLVGAEPSMSPRALLAQIAKGLAAPMAYHTDSLRETVLYALRHRKSAVAVVIDEAQLLYDRIDTLETLRRLGDKARNRMGILVAGNE